MESTLSNYTKVLQAKKENLQQSNKSIVDDWNYILQSKNNTFVPLLNGLITSYADSIEEKTNRLDSFPFKELTDWYQEVLHDNEKHAKEGHNFNIFSLLSDKFNFNIKETMHSQLIKFLLDNKESHGQGNLFLMEVLKMLEVESPEVNLWNVTAEIGRIDVLIERKYPKCIIIIENKSNWAIDQQNQLYRYWYQAIFQKTNEYCKQFYENNSKNYQILYLAPNRDKVLEEQSISKPKEYVGGIFENLPDKVPMQIKTVTFDEHVQMWLDRCLKVLPESNHRIREYIIQYQALCNNL